MGWSLLKFSKGPLFLVPVILKSHSKSLSICLQRSFPGHRSWFLLTASYSYPRLLRPRWRTLHWCRRRNWFASPYWPQPLRFQESAARWLLASALAGKTLGIYFGSRSKVKSSKSTQRLWTKWRCELILICTTQKKKSLILAPQLLRIQREYRKQLLRFMNYT